MSTEPVRPDDSIPIEIGWYYQLGSATNNWVEIVEITQRKVRYLGVYPTIADQTVLKTQFDDLVSDYRIGGYFLITEDLHFDLQTENGFDLFTEGA